MASHWATRLMRPFPPGWRAPSFPVAPSSAAISHLPPFPPARRTFLPSHSNRSMLRHPGVRVVQRVLRSARHVPGLDTVWSRWKAAEHSGVSVQQLFLLPFAVFPRRWLCVSLPFAVFPRRWLCVSLPFAVFPRRWLCVSLCLSFAAERCCVRRATAGGDGSGRRSQLCSAG